MIEQGLRDTAPADHRDDGGPVSSLAVLDRPWPIYLIGDSHVLPFSDMLVKDSKYYRETFITRARYCPGLTALGFITGGKLNPMVGEALVAEGLLTPSADGSMVATHLISTGLANDVSIARGRSRSFPPIIIHCGELDVREGILPRLPPNCDFIIPDDNGDDSRVPTWEVSQIIPFALLEQLIEQVTRPLFNGLKWFRAMGLADIYLHSLPPPSAPAEPIGLRYKLVRLMNSVYRKFCEQEKIKFLDIWDDVTSGGLIRQEFFLDRIHLNRKASLISLETMLRCRVDSSWHRLPPICDHWIAAKQQAFDALYEAGGPKDAELRNSFKQVPITTLDLGRDWALHIAEQLDYCNDFGNPLPQPDWVGLPRAPLTRQTTAVPSQHVLDEIFAKFTAPEIESKITSCMDCEWTVLTARAFATHVQPDIDPSAPTIFHIDGSPEGVLRGIIYLDDVDDDGGPFEYLNENQERVRVSGPAGTMILFDANCFDHGGSPCRKRSRKVLDIVFAPRPRKHRRRVMWSGNNLWPVDPFVYSTRGFHASFGAEGAVPTVLGDLAGARVAEEF